jgi:ATP-binding cassette subfamily F protein uup
VISKKLSFKEQKELDELPAIIDDLEKQQKEFEAQMAEADFYKNAKLSSQVLEAFELNKSELENAYKKWDKLEAMKAD